MKNLAALLSTLLLGLAAPAALAAEEAQPDAHRGADAAAPSHAGHGKVNSVDATAGKVNITHDPMKTLKWPKMTMNFTAHDPALLKDIKPGMTVDFEIQKMGNAYHITGITPAQ
jgi:Cu/Ag efflux protein CusF